MLKKILTILLIAAMAVSFAACGGTKKSESKDNDTKVTQAADEAEVEEVTAEGDADDVTAYQEGIDSIVNSYEELLGQLKTLLDTYDGSEEWWTSYKAVYDASGSITDEVAKLADITPEEYEDSYSSIVVAMAAYTDGMDSLGKAMELDAGAEQDTAVNTAIALFDAADELWASAVVDAE